MTTEEPASAGSGWNAWRLGGWGLAAALLLVPLAAMQVTDEVVWTGSDFVFAGVLIGGTGIGLELALRAGSGAYRLGAALLLLAAFLLVWINAAVGMIGSEDNPLNLLYGIVLATLLAGAIGARLRARGMMWTAAAAAVVQVSIGIVAMIAASDEPPGALGLMVLNGGFAALFAAAAWAFHRAARKIGPDR